MAKVKYTAIHRIMVKAKPPEYIEPKTSFMMEEKAGDALVNLGAATKIGGTLTTESEEAPEKKTATAAEKKAATAAEKKAAAAEKKAAAEKEAAEKEAAEKEAAKDNDDLL